LKNVRLFVWHFLNSEGLEPIARRAGFGEATSRAEIYFEHERVAMAQAAIPLSAIKKVLVVLST
jgi:hypothetical protein